MWPSEDIWGVKKYHLRREQKAQGRKVCSLFCCWAIYESIPTAFVKLGVNQVLGIGWCIKSILHTASIQCLGDFFWDHSGRRKANHYIDHLVGFLPVMLECLLGSVKHLSVLIKRSIKFAEPRDWYNLRLDWFFVCLHIIILRVTFRLVLFLKMVRHSNLAIKSIKAAGYFSRVRFG